MSNLSTLNTKSISELDEESSFKDVEIVNNPEYIILIINGVSFNCKKSEE